MTGRLRGVQVLCALVLAASMLVPTAMHAQQPPVTPVPTPAGPRVDERLVRQLRQEAGGQAQIAVHAETGMVRFVGASPGRPIALATRVAATAPAEDAARAFMARYGPLFGVQNQARDLAVKRQTAHSGGRSIVRLAQTHHGIPVFAGEVVVHLDSGKNVQAATGELLPDIAVSTTPDVSADQARQTAIQVTARAHGLAPGQLTAGATELWIYNRALVGDPGPKLTQLVWRTEVTAGPLDPIRELVLIDAHDGGIALQFNQIETTKSRQTYTANNTGTLPGALVCNESNPTCAGGDTDAIAAHQFAGHTYDFYQAYHGRDSLNGSGSTLISTVHFGVNFENAFWTGTQMVYGDAFSRADDVVAHELTHGVTDFESGLLYFRQAGAINESLSDVWGEFIDLTNATGTDSAAVRWQIGEDLPGIGAFRNMANPPAFDDADRMTSPLYRGSNADNGGVHHNSGVNNKAVSLLVDGGTFNGRTVTGIGIEKAAKVYYEVQTNLLTPGSDYADLYTALQQACTSLLGTAGISSTDCAAVLSAAQSVEMNLPPVVGAAVQAPVCSTGETPSSLFADDLENPSSGNWASAAVTGGNSWAYPQQPKYTNTTSGTKNLHGLNRNTTASYVMARTASVTLPPGAFLRFNHAWDFDTDVQSNVLRYWDGGILEYSTNDGASWTNASPLFTHGGYTGTLRSSAESPGSTNPLQGQHAWVGSSDYGSARLDLSTLAGQSFRFRFRIGTDSSIGDNGWFVDDVRIYTCSGAPPCQPRLPVRVAVVRSGPGLLQVTATAGHGALRQIRFGTDARPLVNAAIDLPGGPSGATSGFVHTVPPGTTQLTFSVRQVAVSAVTVPLVVTDDCGAWETFVGSGPSGL